LSPAFDPNCTTWAHSPDGANYVDFSRGEVHQESKGTPVGVRAVRGGST
jgi:hypothetical protein